MSENTRDFYLKSFPLKVTTPLNKRSFKNGEKVKVTVQHESGFGFNLEYVVNVIEKKLLEHEEDDYVIVRPFEDFDCHMSIDYFGIKESDSSFSTWLYSALVHAYGHDLNQQNEWLQRNKIKREHTVLYFPSLYLHIMDITRIHENRSNSYFEDLIYRNRTHGTSNVGDFYFESVLHPPIILNTDKPTIKQNIDIIVRDSIYTISAEYRRLDEPDEYHHYKTINSLHRALTIESDKNVRIELNIQDIQSSYSLTEREKKFIISQIYLLLKDNKCLANFVYDGSFYATDPFNDEEKGKGVYKSLFTHKTFYIRHKKHLGVYSSKSFLNKVLDWTEEKLDDLNSLPGDCVNHFLCDSSLMKFIPKDILFNRSVSVIEPRLIDLEILNEEETEQGFYDITVKCLCRIDEVAKFDGTITLDHSKTKVISSEEYITLRLHHEIGNVLSMDISIVDSSFDGKFFYEITPSDLHRMAIEVIGKIMYLSDYNESFFEDYIDIYLSVYHLKHIDIEDDNIPSILSEILVDKVIFPCEQDDISLCIDSEIVDYDYGRKKTNQQTTLAHGYFHSPDILSLEENVSDRKKMHFSVEFCLEGSSVEFMTVRSFDNYDIEFLSDAETMDNADYEIVRFIAVHIVISKIIKDKGIYWFLSNEKEIYESMKNLK